MNAGIGRTQRAHGEAVQMPALERKLREQAKLQGIKPGSRRWFAYVYGTLNKQKKGKKR